MKKKALIPFYALLGLIVGIILAVGVLNNVLGVFKTKPKAEVSFDNLIKMVNDIKQEDSQLNLDFYMNKGDIIVFLDKGSKMVRMELSGANIRKVFSQFILADQDCSENSGCICLCKDVNIEKESLVELNPPRVECRGEIDCREVRKDFFYNQGYFGSLFVFDAGPGLVEFKDGMVLQRGWVPQFEVGYKPGIVFISNVNEQTAQKTIYLENYKGVVGICFLETPCITEDAKKRIDAKELAPSFVNAYDECLNENIPEGQDVCACSTFDLKAKLPEEYMLSIKGTTIRLFDEENIVKSSGHIPVILNEYNTDKASSSELNDLELTTETIESNKNYLFEDIKTQTEKMVFVRFKEKVDFEATYEGQPSEPEYSQPLYQGIADPAVAEAPGYMVEKIGLANPDIEGWKIYESGAIGIISGDKIDKIEPCESST